MSQILTMILFAVAALVVLFQLYSVLGRRVGRQPEDLAEGAKPQAPRAPEEEVAAGAAPTGVAALRARDPRFEIGTFLKGARSAYEIIVTAYAENDREALEDLVSPAVRRGFETGMEQKAAQGIEEQLEFLHPPRGDVENVEVDGDTARVRVRFLAEQRVRSRSAAGEAVDDRRTAEVWTFERNLKSRDPNWLLTRVDAAQT